MKMGAKALRWVWHLQTTLTSHSSINFQPLLWHKEQKCCRFSIPTCVRASVSMRRGAERPSRSGGRDSATTSCIYSRALLWERMANNWVRKEWIITGRLYHSEKEATSPKRTRFDLKDRTQPVPPLPHSPRPTISTGERSSQHVCVSLLERWRRLTLSKELDLGCSAAGEVVGVC